MPRHHVRRWAAIARHELARGGSCGGVVICSNVEERSGSKRFTFNSGRKIAILVVNCSRSACVDTKINRSLDEDGVGVTIEKGQESTKSGCDA
jgi:hypothetical protein